MTAIAPSPNFMKGVYYLSLNTGRTLPGVVLMVDVTTAPEVVIHLQLFPCLFCSHVSLSRFKERGLP